MKTSYGDVSDETWKAVNEWAKREREIDRQKWRRETAIAAMQGLLSNEYTAKDFESRMVDNRPQVIAESAVACADALLAKLGELHES